MSKDNLDTCLKCSGPLESGYLLGKQNRIRWSSSNKGMTIFHGVPLIKLEKGFWHRSHWWKYAPSIAAKRCKQCRLVIFSYNNDQKENLANERNASLLIAIFLILSSIIVVIAAYLGAILSQSIPLFVNLILGAFALLIFIFGMTFLIHTINKSSLLPRFRQNNK